MKTFRIGVLASLLFASTTAALAADAKDPTSVEALRYSMLRNGINQSHVPSPVIKAACTGAATCCCRAGSQLFCSTPDACSKMGGACSAGCY